MISNELAAHIRRLHLAEGLPPGTIARHLSVHRDTVLRVVLHCDPDAAQSAPAARSHSKLDPFMPWLRETLAALPGLAARRLYDMACERGYVGGPDHFRHVVGRLRPRRQAEAFLRLRTLPGEQAQVDWAHFGTLAVAGGVRKLYAFVMVLSYCRMIFLRFGFDIGMAGFVRGHVEAFAAFGGVARTLLYDNLKSAVVERIGDVVRFHPELIALSSHYHYEPRPVKPRKGNQKGRVERAIRYIRDNFFAGRKFTDIDDLNAQADAWVRLQAASRPWPEERKRTVQQAFEHEQPLLRKLPGAPYDAHERVAVSVGKTPYVRFDRNDYSVPHDCVGRPLTVVASLLAVRVFDGQRLVAEHARNFGVHQPVENRAHIAALRDAKHNAGVHGGQQWLLRIVPEVEPLLVRLAQRQGSIGTAVAQLVRLCQSYGADELRAAVASVASDPTACHPNSISHALKQRRLQQGREMPNEILPVVVTAGQLECPVQQHPLANYDDSPHSGNHQGEP